eukprot:TRINITY_DN13790_c0_g1_i1.p1 TRINITY_DN13790_c0_g1~~TRINITY_DN13790_c0_g1_i1.p1  ORF type:complete len:106 (+),score=19.26 TRINITY_DN13790_c0_g1_i1:46-318(+)
MSAPASRGLVTQLKRIPYEVYPLCAALTVGLGCLAFFSTKQLTTNPEITIDKSKHNGMSMWDTPKGFNPRANLTKRVPGLEAPSDHGQHH